MKKTANKEKPRILYFDILNVIACFSVILLHHNGLVHNYSPEYRFAWAQALAVEVIAFFAVPVFLLISGATLMEYRQRYGTKTFFQKRLSRVLIPFVIWSIIAFIYTVARGQYVVDFSSIRQLWDTFMFSKMMSVYWFFPVIISIYLAMPIFSLLAKPEYRKWLWYLVTIGLTTYSVLPALTKLLGLGLNNSYQLPATGGGFIIYPILGYLLATTKISKKVKIIIGLSAIACLLLRYLITYFLTISDGSTNSILFSYLYFTAVIPAVAVFLLAQSIPWNNFINDKYQKILITVSSCSLGIYLIHMFIMDIELTLLNLNGSQFVWRLLMPVVTYALCLAIVWLVKSDTLSKRLFP